MLIFQPAGYRNIDTFYFFLPAVRNEFSAFYGGLFGRGNVAPQPEE